MGWLGDGLGWVWNHTVGPIASGATGFVWSQFMSGFVAWIVDAVAWFVGRVLSLLEDSTRVDLGSAWFAGSDGPYRKVLGIAAVLLVGFVFLGIIQGLLAGDAMGMVLRIARDLPLSILGMVITIAATQKFLELSDAMAHAVLRGGGDDAKEVLRVLTAAGSFSGQSSFVVALLGLLCVVTALLVWIELVVRAAMIYLLVALSPLVFAAMVWPATRGMLRRLVELGLALIFSKVVIAIAFSVGAAALAGVGDSGHADAGTSAAVTAGAGTLFSGVVIFGLAAFAPFVIMRLFPAAEAAIVAQGVSRGPARTAHHASADAFYLQRLAGGGHGSTDWSSQAADVSTTAPSAEPVGGASPGAASQGAAAGAAAGPAAPVVVAAEAGRRVGAAVADRAREPSSLAGTAGENGLES